MMASGRSSNASVQTRSVKLDLTREHGDELPLRHVAATVGQGDDEPVALDLTVGSENCPILMELVRCTRGTLKVSARSWEPANARYLRQGLEENDGLTGLALDLEGCRCANDDLRCLVDAIGQQKQIVSFELCLYQEERETDIAVDESIGKAVGNLLENGTLQHLSFVNWFGYVMSVGFVRELCRGLANTTALVSFELRNCVLPAASYGCLVGALRSRSIPTLRNLTVGIDSATLGEIVDLFKAMKQMKNLRSIRITPCHLPNEVAAASVLEQAVQENRAIHYVTAFSSPKVRRRRQRRRLQHLLEVNRHVSSFHTLLSTPGMLPRSVWPIIIAHLSDPRVGDRGSNDDAVVRRHRANHISKALRQILPWLLTRSREEEATAGP